MDEKYLVDNEKFPQCGDVILKSLLYQQIERLKFLYETTMIEKDKLFSEQDDLIRSQGDEIKRLREKVSILKWDNERKENIIQRNMRRQRKYNKKI